MNKLFFIFLFFYVCLFPASYFAQQNTNGATQRNNLNSSRMSPLGCTFATFGEYILPGVGYIASGQYAKAVGFGVPRWLLISEASQNERSKYYQKDSDQTFKFEEEKDTKSKKNEVVFNYNKETWNAQYYRRVSSNIGLYNIWDLYEGGCGPHASTFVPPTAIFRPWVYGKRVLFWIPMVALAAFYSMDNNTNYTWYLGRGLKRETVERDSYIANYTTGIGEETFFRGTLQKSLYYLYRDYFGTGTSHHLGVVTASALFGLAHNGQGTSASAGTAFLMGLYLGYTYQTTPDYFDLITPIAIHTFWNMAVAASTINNAEFHESDEPVSKDIKIELANVYFEF